MKIDKPRLRNTLRKLRQIPFDRSLGENVSMAPQECLDFLAMLAGLKPVCLVGRGFDDPDWIAGVEALAHEMKLHVVTGLKWYAEPKHGSMPVWYHDLNAEPPDHLVLYISKSRQIAIEVMAVCETGNITIDQEAQLLGYPACCVRDHYRRSRLSDEMFLLLLRRTSGDDEEEMKRIVRDDVGMSIETDQEKSLYAEAMRMASAPFTSINMCPECAGDPARPTLTLSKKYEKLAKSVSQDLAAEIAHYQSLIGH